VSAESRNKPARRRPCIWRRGHRSGEPPPPRSGDRRRSLRAALRDRAAPTAPPRRPDRRTSRQLAMLGFGGQRRDRH
jgi:hypothetical protein